MSNPFSLGQSVASTGTPVSIPKRSDSVLHKGAKTGDSLGNSSGPGYEFMGGKKKKTESTSAEEKNPFAPPQANTVENETRANTIRLQVGWETLLVVQRKICEKAKNIITSMEAPVRYAVERRGKSARLKSRGCIVDLQSAENTLMQAPDSADDDKKSA